MFGAVPPRATSMIGELATTFTVSLTRRERQLEVDRLLGAERDLDLLLLLILEAAHRRGDGVGADAHVQDAESGRRPPVTAS